jgi:hypothetical protein
MSERGEPQVSALAFDPDTGIYSLDSAPVSSEDLDQTLYRTVRGHCFVATSAGVRRVVPTRVPPEMLRVASGNFTRRLREMALAKEKWPGAQTTLQPAEGGKSEWYILAACDASATTQYRALHMHADDVAALGTRAAENLEFPFPEPSIRDPASFRIDRFRLARAELRALRAKH